VSDVVLLTVTDGPAGCGCGSADTCGGGHPRVPVLACRDALARAGAAVKTVAVGSDADIDAALDALGAARLVVAVTVDGQLRAVLRRMVRRYAPAPGQRPDDLPRDRTVPDLPALGVLPMAPSSDDLAAQLGLPRDPTAVAEAVLAGRTRRFDLLRNDGGSVTLHGCLLGGTDEAGRTGRFAARVEVDDAVLSDGTEPLLAAAVANAAGYAGLGGLPLLTRVDPADGVLDVAVATPAAARGRFGRRTVQVEVRRAHGRAVSITPRDEVPLLDDGVVGHLGRKRSWWMERGVWAAYTA
jgi:hypothetical protein